MKYEDAINKIQGNGRFTIAMMLILSVLAFQSAGDIMSIVFVNYTPTFKCASSIQNMSDVRNFKWTQKECNAEFLNFTTKRTDKFKCTSWIYDKSVMKNTLVTEFDLVCDKAYMVTTIDTIYFTGIAIGNLLGVFGDTVGRKRLILITSSIEIIVNLILPFATNLWLIIALRFLWGLPFCKVYQSVGIMMEFVSSDKRAFYGNNIWTFWTFGYMTQPMFQYLMKDWRLAKWISNCFYIFYGLLLILPESPRWLSLKGKNKEAKKILHLMARRNRSKNIHKDSFDNIEVTVETGKFTDLFRYKVLRLKLVVGIIAQSAMNLGYTGISIDGSYISTNLFLNIFAGGAVELLTGVTGWLMSSKINRLTSLSLLYVLSAIAMVTSAYIPRTSLGLIILQAIVGCLAKFTLTAAYCILDMYLPEVFPTSIRNLAMFIIIGIGSAAAILAPTVNRINIYLKGLSSILYTIACLVSGGLIYLLLPETKGCPLPQNLKDGEMLRKGNEEKYKRELMTRSEIEIEAVEKF